MKTELVWAEVTRGGGEELPILPEGWGTFDCDKLERGERVKVTVSGDKGMSEMDCRVVVVYKIFGYRPIEEAPFGKDCDCVQWVEIELCE